MLVADPALLGLVPGHPAVRRLQLTLHHLTVHSIFPARHRFLGRGLPAGLGAVRIVALAAMVRAIMIVVQEDGTWKEDTESFLGAKDGAQVCTTS